MKRVILPARTTAKMMRSVATALVGTAVLAAAAGCAYQQPSIYLPDVTPPGAGSSSIQAYPGYGSGSGSGYGSMYGYGSPYGYQSGYGYNEPYYAGQAPDPYGYYRYPYPYRYVVVPCPDNNSDGRCDRRPTKDHDH